MITPQGQESGYWTKVLTNTFGSGNSGAQTISAGLAMSTGLHQPKVRLVCSPANIWPIRKASVNTNV